MSSNPLHPQGSTFLVLSINSHSFSCTSKEDQQEQRHSQLRSFNQNMLLSSIGKMQSPINYSHSCDELFQFSQKSQLYIL